MAVSNSVIKQSCDIYVCKKIKLTDIAEISAGIDWAQVNNTSQEQADLVAAHVARDAYLIGIWWKKKFEQYIDQKYRPTCVGFYDDDVLNESEIIAIFDQAPELGCY